MAPPAPILILGIGNILRKDDGVGVRAVEALRERGVPPSVELVDGGTLGLGLVDVIACREKAIVIDALEGGGEPGALYRISAEDLGAETGPVLSVHDFGLEAALALAGRLSCAPRATVIFGVEPGDVSEGLELTPAVAAAIPALLDIVLAELARG